MELFLWMFWHDHIFEFVILVHYILFFLFFFFLLIKKKDTMKREAENMKTSSFYESMGLDSWSLI